MSKNPGPDVEAKLKALIADIERLPKFQDSKIIQENLAEFKETLARLENHKPMLEKFIAERDDKTFRAAMKAQEEEDRKFLGKHTRETAQQYIKSFYESHDADVQATMYQGLYGNEFIRYEQQKHNVELLKKQFNL